MKRVNVRELHHRTGAIIDAVSNGEVVVVATAAFLSPTIGTAAES